MDIWDGRCAGADLHEDGGQYQDLQAGDLQAERGRDRGEREEQRQEVHVSQRGDQPRLQAQVWPVSLGFCPRQNQGLVSSQVEYHHHGLISRTNPLSSGPGREVCPSLKEFRKNGQMAVSALSASTWTWMKSTGQPFPPGPPQ